jgi:hypothetical protein
MRGRVRVPTPSVQGIAAALKRYDGGSGSAVFRGAIPFAPGVVTGAGDLTNKRILVNGAEPAGGIYIQLLDGRHADNSYRSAYVEFAATCGSAETVPCDVRLNETRTVSDIGSPVDAVELSPRSWQAAPTLFGITDATYLCNSKLAPLPLIPLTDPRIPASTLTWITTAFDTWNASNNASNSATYDEQYPIICRYMVTGELNWLAQALERNQTEDNTRAATVFSYQVANAATNWNASGLGYPDLNPSNYSGRATADDEGVPAEWVDTSLASWMIYGLTGWEYAKLTIEKNTTGHPVIGFNDSAESSTFSPTGGTYGQPRQNFRQALQQGVLGAMLNMTRSIDTRNGRVYKSLSNEWGSTIANRSMKDRVIRRIDRLKAYAEGLVSGTDVPTYWPKLWGTGADRITDTVGRTPNFQFTTSASLWMAYYNNVYALAAIPTQLDAIASWLRSQVGPGVTPSAGAGAGRAVYGTPYECIDPADVPTYDDNGVYTTVVAWLFAWQWARTGDTTARDLFDHVCDVRHLYYNASTNQEQSPTGADARKIFGELFYLCYHAAALRAGVDPLTGE